MKSEATTLAPPPAGIAHPEYGFGGRLTEGFPSQIIVDITEVCNLACVHCPHPAFKLSEHYGARYLEPELNQKLVDEVRAYGPGGAQYIRYTSDGEPLIHPKGYEMIEYAVKNSGVFVTITTNGTIMNEKRTRRLLEAGVHMIDISLDAFSNDTYAKVRVGGDLDVTRANVQRLIKWRTEAGSGTKVVVSFVEQKQNAHEVEAFKSFWEGEGADFVVIRRQHSVAGAVIDISRILHERNKKIARRPCVYPWERIVLNPRGHISFCPADWVRGSELVDFRTNTLQDTWNGPKYKALREAHLTNQYQNHGFCGQCPDWAEVRWPHEGRAYADMILEFKGQS
jgi:MoaA/NifB/PqqE/SkfB family radical SAM enzyme